MEKQMEISIQIEELQKRKLFVATPMYGGQCAGMFTKSCNDLSALCMHYKIEAKFYYLFNESLVTRARNYTQNTEPIDRSTGEQSTTCHLGFRV